MAKCDECQYCPLWETGFAMAEDFESQLYKSGECKFDGEPVLFTQGQYLIDGTSDGASYLGDCKNFKARRSEK